MTYSRNDLVTKSNDLIEANYKLTTTEQKIVAFLASKVQPNDQEFKPYRLSIKEFAKVAGLKGQSYYSEIKKITFQLMKKAFQAKVGNKTIQASWISSAVYNENEGTVDICFDPVLRPFLLELKERFTSYRLGYVMALKSSYSIRLFELLKQYENIGSRTFEVDMLRKKLGADNVYPVYGNFKQRVLMSAKKELQTKTDICFEMEEIKQGRKVHKIHFKIKSKTASKLDGEQLTLLLSNIEPGTTHNIAQAASKLGIQVNNEVLEKWAQYGEENVLKALNSIKGNKRVKHPIPYVTKILSNMQKEEEKLTENKKNKNERIEEQIRIFTEKYETVSEVLPDFLVQASFTKHILENETEVTKEEVKDLWETYKEQIMTQIKKYRDIVREKKRQK